jgi:hypothetical protein
VREVSAAFQAAIAADNLKLAELFEIELASGEVYRYTTHNVDLVWDAAGNTYAAAMPLSRSEATYRNTGQFDEISLYLANMDGDLANKVFSGAFDTAILTCKRIRWDAVYAADEEITVFKGPVNISYNRRVLMISCQPTIGTLNIQVPRHTWQENCNYALFETGCGLVRSAYKYSGIATGGTINQVIDNTAGSVYYVAFDGADEDNPLTVGEIINGSDGTPGAAVCISIAYKSASTGVIYYCQVTHQFVNNETITGDDSGNTVRVNGTPAEDTDFYEMGEIEFTSGVNTGQRRQIYGHSGAGRSLNRAVPAIVRAGDLYDIYPGCDGTGNTCRNRFGNVMVVGSVRAEIFRGFPYIPKVEDLLT